MTLGYWAGTLEIDIHRVPLPNDSNRLRRKLATEFAQVTKRLLKAAK